MKLGTETASVMNHLYSRSVNGQPEPEVGMGATFLHWTDRHAGTIIAWDGKVVTVQRDHAKRIDSNGMSEMQEYEYSPNPKGAVYHFRREKRGMWTEVRRNPSTGRWVKVGGAGLAIGYRRAYYDFSL